MGLLFPPSEGVAASASPYLIIGGSTVAVTNGTELLAAYVTAQAATPQGAALGAANRFTIFLLPGVYDLGAGILNLATQFIDVVGLSTNTGPIQPVDASDLGDTLIKSSSATATVRLTNATGGDIALANFAIQNTSGNFAFGSSVSIPSAFHMQNMVYHSTGGTNRPTQTGVSWAGTCIDCRTFQTAAFGASFGGGTGDSVTGTFIRCRAASVSFGDKGAGLFIDCEADGSSMGRNLAQGTYVRCREVVIDGTVGGLMAGTFTGTAIDCNTAGAGLTYTSGLIQNSYFGGVVENRGLVALKAATARVGGSIRVDTTAVGNVGAGEDNLITYSVPAATLATNGDYLEFDCFGTFAANANAKQLKVFFGATAIFASTALIFNGLPWRAHGKIVRTGAATQKCIAEFTIGGTLLGALTTTITTYATAAETLSGAVTFKCTGEDSGGVPVNDSVVQEGLVLKWFPTGNA